MNQANLSKLLKIGGEFSSVFQLVLGVVFASIGLKAFLIPNNFLDGGVTGIAILLNHISGIHTSYWLIVISIPFLLIGFFTVSRVVFYKSVFTILALAFVIEAESFTVITEDKLLIAFFGGGTLGLGIGLAIKNGAVLDGSELLGIFINNRLGFSISKVIFSFNVIVFLFASIYLPLENILYSVLTFFITARVIDVVIAGFDDFIGIMIVSTRSEEIQLEIDSKLGVGMTVLKGERGFGKNGIRENQSVIKTVINRIDIKKLEEIIYAIDSKAFVEEYNVKKVNGGILRRLFKTR